MRTEIGAAATARQYRAGAGGLNPVAGSPAQPIRGRKPRQWTAEEQAIIDGYVDGAITYDQARRQLRCGHELLVKEATARGRPAKARPGGRGNKREWTAEEDDLIRRVIDKRMSVENARLLIGCGREQVHRRMGDLPRKPIPADAGDPSAAAPQRTTRPARVGPSSPNCAPAVEAGAASSPASGWTVIATRGERSWVMHPDAPVLIEDARRLVEQGRAITAQRRVPGGFELLFRWVRS